MNEDSHMGGVASALVMLAAIATTFSTYTYYKDDQLATQYENDQVTLEQTASALMSLRLEEEAMKAAADTSKSDDKKVEVKKEVELQ